MARFYRRRKFCRFTAENVTYIDYKDIETLKQYVTENGKIVPSRITGTKAPDLKSVKSNVRRLRKHTQLPIAVGFGVKTAEQARTIARDADGVVVGSALVNAVKESLTKAGKPTSKTVKAVHALVSNIAQGLRN